MCNCGKLIKAAAAATGLFVAIEYMLHEMLLKAIYLRPHYEHLWNQAEVIRARMPAMFLAYILIGFVFAKIYSRGYEPARPALVQGLRYGLWFGLLCGAFAGLLCYAVMPISWKLAGVWAAGGMVECLVAGVAVAFIYRSQSGSPLA
ncbi:MAG: hypothetical protein ABIG11_01830 [bacterium]